MSFWAPAPKSPAENGIPKKSLDTSLVVVLLNTIVSRTWIQVVLIKRELGNLDAILLK